MTRHHRSVFRVSEMHGIGRTVASRLESAKVGVSCNVNDGEHSNCSKSGGAGLGSGLWCLGSPRKLMMNSKFFQNRVTSIISSVSICC